MRDRKVRTTVIELLFLHPGRLPDDRPSGMTASDSEALARFVAEHLRAHANEIADTWIDALRSRLGVRPARFLPTDSVRDHVPELVAEVADQISRSDAQISARAVESLRTFAELRREQGYHESEVLAELGALHLSIFAEFGDALERYSGRADSATTARVASQLHQILDDLASLVLGVLRERERQESRELSRRLAEFIRTVLHELRDPLNAATQSARMLATEELGGRKDERLLQVMLRNLEKIDDLLSDLSMVEDVEVTRADSRLVHLPAAVQDVLDQCAEEARKYDVTVAVADEVPDIVVDAGAVEIPLRNLVWNAIKYSDRQEDRRWVNISFEPEGEGGTGVPRWRISVADNGIGIPQDAQDQVFDRQFRADPAVAEGSGLGLSIAQQMARQRGGRIWFESTPGAGSVFHLEVRELLEEREDT